MIVHSNAFVFSTSLLVLVSRYGFPHYLMPFTRLAYLSAYIFPDMIQSNHITLRGRHIIVGNIGFTAVQYRQLAFPEHSSLLYLFCFFGISSCGRRSRGG